MSNTPYCRTCHKAGKSYSEYTNHWTRDKPGDDGNIICPVILNTVCNYCKEKGHWLKYCPNLSKKQCTTETYNQPTIQPLNSWANILKRDSSNQNRNNIMNIDVSICDIEDMSRPPSPDYPPPTHYDYPSPSPDYL